MMTGASAELRRPIRTFEFFLENTTGFSNNYWGLGDIMQEKLVFDLAEISSSMSDDGFKINMNEKLSTGLRLNFERTCRIELFSGFEGFGTVTIDKDFFDFISGFDGGTYTMTASCTAEAYMTAGFQVQTFIYGFGLRARPTIFAPIIYCPEVKGKGTYRETSEGLQFDAEANARIYSSSPGEDLFEKDTLTDFGKLMSGAGFSLELGLENRFLPNLDTEIFTHIPIVPGKLDYYTEAGFKATGKINNILGKRKDGEENYSWDYEKKEKTYGEDTIYLHRPFKLGIEGAWRPLGEWFTVRPEIALAVHSPFSEYAEASFEYSIETDFSLFNLMTLSFCSNCQNDIYSEQIGFIINSYLMEFDFSIASSSPDFLKSFKFPGATIFTGIKIGL